MLTKFEHYKNKIENNKSHSLHQSSKHFIQIMKQIPENIKQNLNVRANREHCHQIKSKTNAESCILPDCLKELTWQYSKQFKMFTTGISVNCPNIRIYTMSVYNQIFQVASFTHKRVIPPWSMILAIQIKFILTYFVSFSFHLTGNLF